MPASHGPNGGTVGRITAANAKLEGDLLPRAAALARGSNVVAAAAALSALRVSLQAEAAAGARTAQERTVLALRLSGLKKKNAALREEAAQLKAALRCLMAGPEPEPEPEPEPKPAVATDGDTRGAQYTIQREMKSCGHMCYPSNLAGCCACEDIRPVLPGNTYTKYVDGRGYVDEGARDDGYCPVCNDKNYEMWMKKMRKELEEKAAKQLRDKLAQQAGDAAALEDQARAAANAASTVQRFTYSNGDVYEGHFDSAGERCGWGKMVYADDPNSDRMETSYTTYEGEWLHGKHHGQGTKEWGDGITYVGTFKANQMHGHGRYTLVDESCGEDVMEGTFANDEFVG